MKKRLWLFKGIALLLPLFALILVEGLLRLVGYGHDVRLFVEDPKQKEFWVMNQYASEKYFTETDNATIGNFEPFRKRKADGTLRIFVLGESTTIGYPYMHNGSFHRWLQYRLLQTFPEKEFEIINLSLTAVNSYTVFGFAQELAEYQPDAVLVYTGHNEYYGALGVGSTSSLARSPHLVRFVLRLREFRLMQLINHLLTGVRKAVMGKQVDLRENLMKRMAADQQIPYGSATYQQGIDQFQTNLTDLCQLLTSQKIPVFISNLVSNEKDLKPFISSPGSDAATSAQQQYQLARQAYAQGNFRQARHAFVQAKELDLLRFRAPEAMNKVIRDVAARYPGVTVVDTRARFNQYSPQRILGKETLLEHVHPNLLGYSLLSDAFYEALKKQQLITPNPKDELSFDQLRQRMPITAVDSLKGAYEIMILKEGWPFNELMPAEEKRNKTIEEQLAGGLVVKQIAWRDAMNQLAAYYAKANNPAKTVQVTEALLLEYPYEPSLYDQASKQWLAQTKNEQAVVYLKKAFQLENTFERAQQLFITLLKLDQPEAAMPYLQFAATHNPSTFSLIELQAFVDQLIAIKKQYAADSTNVNLSNQLAAGYLKFANASAAAKYVARSLELDKNNALARQLNKQILSIKQ
ncbi:GDSL-type esterase/lipase family protein [Spirosoma radiotolerans]|uniref:GDSL-type esterase/lipase family protein n=1 Tax=Spirosoma radiotolerans TaxID=1379870 RepID=UPI0009E57F02|nr:GDSL-type esterase/lipase family protein [Spirosoma radiotolerans]